MEEKKRKLKVHHRVPPCLVTGPSAQLLELIEVDATSQKLTSMKRFDASIYSWTCLKIKSLCILF